MRYKVVFTILISIYSAGLAKGQSTNDFMIGTAADILKTDNNGLLEKAQLGIEGNFFVKRNFSVTAGVDFWTERDDSFVFGTRWYFYHSLLVRFRALTGENDFSIGAGSSIPLTSNLRLELLGDYYFKKEMALRGGIAYIIR